MKKKKKKQDRLKYITSSALMLMLAFLLAVTSTLAWFSMTISSSVSGMWFEVATQDNLLAAVKQWKYREQSATKWLATRHETTRDEASGEYRYIDNGTQRIATDTNIQKINNNYYVYTLADGRELNPDFVIASGEEYSVYLAGSLPINGNLYELHQPSGDEYLLSGYFLEEPELLTDYTNLITESQIAKVCMNDRNASKITDLLTNATTINREDGFASSITNLVGLNGHPYKANHLAGGDRYTITAITMPETTVFKYEFDLYFIADGNLKISLNTRTSQVRSGIADSDKYEVKAWRDIKLDDHTTDADLKNYYQTNFSSGETVKKGTKIVTEVKNAIRVGFSDSDGKPIGIWDPNVSYGWTKNDTDSNLALEYYNMMMTNGGDSALKGTPAKALLTSSSRLIESMKEGEDGKYHSSIKMTIWMEGYDADCFDSLLDEVINLKFDFIALEVEEEANQ